tara:strand:- start:612 stop:863 length:252 start_codon:yes stop_codon:yes gene_type:complete
MKQYEPYPNQSPGSAYCDEMDRRAERVERQIIGYVDEVLPSPGRESWRDKARRLGIRAYSFDDFCDKFEALEQAVDKSTKKDT